MSNTSYSTESIKALAEKFGATQEVLAAQLSNGISQLSTAVDQAKAGLESLNTKIAAVQVAAPTMFASKESVETTLKSVLSLIEQSKETVASGYKYATSLLSPAAPAPLSYADQAKEFVSSGYDYFTSFFVTPKPEPTTTEIIMNMLETAANTTLEFVTENSTAVAVGVGACALGYCAYRYYNSADDHQFDALVSKFDFSDSQ